MILQFYTLNIIGMKKNVITLLALFVFTITHAQNVGIGTTSPNASAQLEVRATNKGLLIPRVNLTSTTDVTTIPSPATSLLVFNTNAAITGGSSTGFYAWSGTAWVKIALTTDITSGWGVNGNTLSNSDFFGTNNQQPLRFKLNGNNAGFIARRRIYIGEGAGLSENNSYGGNNASIGIGSGALGSSTSAVFNNIAIGDSTLHVLNNALGTADRNIALGHLALKNKENGDDNVAIGYASQKNVDFYSIGDNVSIGSYTLENVTSGGNNIAIGSRALQGTSAGLSISSNIAIGADAMRDATFGSKNIAMGFFSLLNNAGDNNIAIADFSLRSNIDGEGNIGLGLFSLHNNVNGDRNIGIGKYSLRNNVNGNFNISIGDSAFYSNDQGDKNVALGFQAGQNNTDGGNNCFIGTNAGSGNTTGDKNIAIGRQTYTQTPAASGNTIIGTSAADTFLMGNNNTLIGTSTDVSGTGLAALGFNSSMALGYDATISANNQVRIGNTTTSSIGGYQGWTNLSDGRFKINIQPNVPGLDFILKLQPITYRLDIDGINKKLGKPEPEAYNAKHHMESTTKAKAAIYTGFVAQEVQTAAQKLGFQFSGVDAPKNDKDFYGLRYAEFVVPLVKAVQEQQQKIEKVERENADLKNKLTKMMQRIEALEKSK
jgi:trimeric autotransporter adhesin